MHMALYLAVGLGIGTAAGMVGIGGGVLLLPILTEIYGMEPRRAAGLTLAVLAFPVAFPGALRYYQHGLITRGDIVPILCIAAGFAAGTYSGALIHPFVNVGILRAIFGTLLLYVAARMILSTHSDVTQVAGGLVMICATWALYWWLRLWGRRNLSKPLTLRERVEESKKKGEEPPIEYYI